MVIAPFFWEGLLSRMIPREMSIATAISLSGIEKGINGEGVLPNLKAEALRRPDWRYQKT